MARPITIIQRGLISYTICVRCNSKLESKYLDWQRATEEIRRKYASHPCRKPEVAGALRDEPSKQISVFAVNL